MTVSQDDTFSGKPGKLAPKTDARDLNLATYLQIENGEDIPLQQDWTVKKTSAWGMMDNNKLNDCAFASAGHLIECWDANLGKDRVVHTEAVLKAFIALTGYDPETGKNNNPVYLSDTLKYWRQHGIGRHRIEIYVSIPLKDHNLVKAAITIFGGISAGFALPKTIEKQTTWELSPGTEAGDSEPGSYGGHAVPVLAYDEETLTCISYGKKQQMTWTFWDTYCDEAFAIVTTDFLKENKNPLGMDLAAMKSDLMDIITSEPAVHVPAPRLRTPEVVPAESGSAHSDEVPARAPRTFARASAPETEHLEAVPETVQEPEPAPAPRGRQVLNAPTVARLNALAAADVRAAVNAIKDAEISLRAEQIQPEAIPVKPVAARNDLGEMAPTRRVRIGANRTQTGSSKDGKDEDDTPKKWTR